MHEVLGKGAISYDDLFMHLGYRFSFGVDYVDLESGFAATSLLMISSKSGPQSSETSYSCVSIYISLTK
jgi:hypothetical protein